MEPDLIAFLAVVLILVLLPCGWLELEKGTNRQVANGVLLFTIAVMAAVAATFAAAVAVPM